MPVEPVCSRWSWWPWQVVVVDGGLEVRRPFEAQRFIPFVAVKDMTLECGPYEILTILGRGGEVLLRTSQFHGFSPVFCAALSENAGVELRYLPSSTFPNVGGPGL